MRPPPDRRRRSFNEVYHAEVEALRPGAWKGFPPAPFEDEAPATAATLTVELETRELHVRNAGKRARAENLRALYDRVGQFGVGTDDQEPLAALCFSGGGIRSATFNLGILQALARRNVLQRFDYLSTVSGGGYIGGWVRAWMARQGTVSVVSQLSSTVARPDGDVLNPLAPEPKPIDRLREFSNYLTPQLGLLSADSWAATAIFVRNLLLIWLVLVPLLAAVVALPQFALLVGRLRPSPVLASVLAGLALASSLLATANIHRARAASLAGENQRKADHRRSDGWIVAWGVLPLVLATLFLALAGQAEARGALCCEPVARRLTAFPFALLWSFVVPAIGWTVGWLPRWLRTGQRPVRLGGEAVALLVSGLASGGVLWLLATTVRTALHDRTPVYVMLAVPLLLGDYLLARVLFVGIASRWDEERSGQEEARAGHAGTTADTLPTDGMAHPAMPAAPAGAAVASGTLDRSEHDREWWARLSGWVLVFALGWLVVSALCLLGGWLLERVHHGGYVASAITALGGVSGVVVALLGKASSTPSGRRHGEGERSLVHRIALPTATLVFCLLLVIALARANIALGVWWTGNPELLHVTHDLRMREIDVSARTASLAARIGLPARTVMHDMVLFAAVPLALLALSFVAGRVVNVNRFSLHGFYRNRLVRAYLGASNPQRRADAFTGFAPADNLRLHALWRPDPASTRAERPLPIVNAALNVVGGDRLAWQQRKAESFSMTPFYSGNFYQGYRDSRLWGGPGGITLGTAIAISGAAANPNMGYHSSPLVTLLMTLFNARLGMWLGNTGAAGERTFDQFGPRWAVLPLVSELFGRTTNQYPFVNLSDGGHFENLGLYEAVLRRCRYVVVSDAGADPDASFDDLGNAIRKIRIDFGIPIRFEQRLRIRARPHDGATVGQEADGEEAALFCAVGTIDYGAVDVDGAGNKAPPGWLLYLKPQLDAAGAPIPVDVASYARGSATFPHESTSDQWFDESQFESYRALGEHIGLEVTPIIARDDDPMALLRSAVASYLAQAERDGRATPVPSPTGPGDVGRYAPPAPGERRRVIL